MSAMIVSIVWGFIQVTLLCTVSLIIAWMCRGRRPQWMTSVLVGACVSSLALAIISIVPPLQWTIAIDDLSTQSAITTTDVQKTEETFELDRRSIHQDTIESQEERELESKTAATQQPSDANPSNGNGIVWMQSLVSQYLHRIDHGVREAEDWHRPTASVRNASLGMFAIVGVMTMTLLWCSSWLYMQRVLRHSQVVDDQDMLDFIALQSKAFGLTRVPTVRESDRVPIGATVGWRRVTVLLHRDWREWTTTERTAVIAHELAHASRHDFVWVILSSWTRIALFFHPMVHLLIHRLRLEQELAADQLAAGKLGSAKVYGRSLASLALRSQLGLQTSNTTFDTMLAAGQICVTRRVMMLRQGSLRPIQTRSRWSLWAIAAIALTAIPLAGLRGTTQEPVVNKPDSSDESSLGTLARGPQATEADQSTDAKKKPLSKEFLAAYPPLEFKGKMVYRPGRLRAGEFGPEAAWIQEWFTIATLGKPLPDRATIHGESNDIISWEDEDRQHGRLSLQASFKEADATIPGQLTMMNDLPVLDNGNYGRRMRTVATRQVNGRTISGVTNSTKSDEPEKWMIDDEQGYFLGTLDEATQYVNGHRFAMESIPEAFRKDYEDAVFAMVYTDCEQWAPRLESFSKGSPKEQEMFMAVPFLKDIVQLGAFFDGCNTPACKVRAVMRDAKSANDLVARARGLIAMASLALATSQATSDSIEIELASSILESLTIEAQGSEVVAQFDVMIPSLSKPSSFAEYKSIDGWMHLNAVVKPVESQQGAIEVRHTTGNPANPGLFGQTIDATEYRNKTVLLSVNVQCDDEMADQSGLFVWASRKEASATVIANGRVPRQNNSPYAGHRTLAAKTIACDGKSSFSMANQKPLVEKSFGVSQAATWRTLSIALDVPSDADHLSFGYYTKNGAIRVKDIRFDVVVQRNGIITESQYLQTRDFRLVDGYQACQAFDAIADVPYNVLIMPTYTIGHQPTNLDFSASSVKAVREAAKPNAEVTR